MSIFAQNAAAFVSLALTQRRLSWMHRRLAIELPALLPHLDDSRLEYHRKEARRLWREAKGHLSFARHELELEAARHGA